MGYEGPNHPGAGGGGGYDPGTSSVAPNAVAPDPNAPSQSTAPAPTLPGYIIDPTLPPGTVITRTIPSQPIYGPDGVVGYLPGYSVNVRGPAAPSPGTAPAPASGAPNGPPTNSATASAQGSAASTASANPGHVLGGSAGPNVTASSPDPTVETAANIATQSAENAVALATGRESPLSFYSQLWEISLQGLEDYGTPPNDTRLYVTYTKTNPKTGKVYSGRTSGYGTPAEIVTARDRLHHMNLQGYGPAVVDKFSINRAAIRGREQMLIDANGGAQSMGGTSGNAINGISPLNPFRDYYIQQAQLEFGP